MINLLSTALLGSAEATINRALALHPAGRARLRTLSGQVIAIHCQSPELTLYLAVYEDSIRLYSHYDGEADTRISGSARALLTLLASQDKNRLFYRDDLDISGRVANASQLQDILAGLEPDWEYPLSKLIGDIPAHALGQGARDARTFAARSGEELRRNLDDYLHRELRYFPYASELERFYDDLDRLRLRLDRARARVNALERTPQP